MVPAADASTQTVAAAWLEKQPHPGGLPATLDEFCYGCFMEYEFDLDDDRCAEAWDYVKSVGTISPIAQALVESARYPLNVSEAFCAGSPLVPAIRRAERLHAIRNGLADYQDVRMGFDMDWRQNMHEKPRYYSSTIEFSTISAFSVICDFILIDSDHSDRRVMSENCMHWLRLLFDNKVICATEFFAVRDAFMHVREDWYTPVNIPVIRASEYDDDTYQSCKAVLQVRRACLLNLWRRARCWLRVVKAFQEMYEDVPHRPGHSGFHDASDHFQATLSDQAEPGGCGALLDAKRHKS